MRRIAAVTMDLWDTLIQEYPGGSQKVAGRRIEKISDLLSASGVVHTKEELEAAYVSTGDFLDMTWSKMRDMPVRDQILFMLSCLDDKLAGKIDKEVLSEIEDAYCEGILTNPPMLLPGAADALRTIKARGYKLGLISNTGRTPGATLRTVMHEMHIADYFDVMTFSNEILVRKPAESAFRLTLEKLRSVPKASVHVGDDGEADIEGAHAVGMHSIQVLRQGGRKSGLADAHVRSLHELADRIETL